jgi:hypothetical protein
MKIRPVGAESIHLHRRTSGRKDGQTGTQTDRHDEANSRFSKFCECIWKSKETVSYRKHNTKHQQQFGSEQPARLGRAMAQAVSRRPLTAEARVQSRVTPCGICGGQSGTGTDFFPSTSVLPCQFHSTGAPLLGNR